MIIFVADFPFVSLRVLIFRVLRSFVPLFCEGSQSFLLLDSSDENVFFFPVLAGRTKTSYSSFRYYMYTLQREENWKAIFWLIFPDI